jgi:hypothetical protein
LWTDRNGRYVAVQGHGSAGACENRSACAADAEGILGALAQASKALGDAEAAAAYGARAR